MSDISKEADLPRLASIEIEPGELAFDPDVTEYTVHLEEGIGKLLVRAKTEKEGDRYTVSGTSLSAGRNEVTVTVTGAGGDQTVYRLHVTVGEEETTTEAPETQQYTEGYSVSFLEHVTAGRNRYISIGVVGCAALALILWITFLIKRILVRRDQIRQKEQRELARQAREERFRVARMQEEELLRQIERLRQKSQAAREEASGLRIIHLDEEEAADPQEEDYGDFDDDGYDEYDDDYDYDEYEDDRDGDEGYDDEK